MVNGPLSPSELFDGLLLPAVLARRAAQLHRAEEGRPQRQRQNRQGKGGDRLGRIVMFTTLIFQLKNFHCKQQIWFEPCLIFQLSLNVKMLEKIWKPDTYFYNGLSSYLHTITR